MAELQDDEKREIVRLLACYYTPAEVAALMREQHEVELTIHQICRYDPTRLKFEAGDWARTLFAEVREAYTKGTTDIEIANQGWRLNELRKLYLHHVKTKNNVQAANVLKQVAEEVGGSYTNERNVKVTKGYEAMDDDERRKEFSDIIEQVKKRKTASGDTVQ